MSQFNSPIDAHYCFSAVLRKAARQYAFPYGSYTPFRRRPTRPRFNVVFAVQLHPGESKSTALYDVHV